MTTINEAIRAELKRTKTGTKEHANFLKSAKTKGMTHVKYTGNEVDYFYNPKTKRKFDPDWN